MKRYISMFLVLLVAVGSLAVPVSAVGFEAQIDSYIDLLDYGTVNDSGSNYFSFIGSESILCPVPVQSEINYVDMVVYCSGAAPITVSAGSPDYDLEALSIVHISGNYYRFYGALYPRAVPSLKISFETGSSDRSWYSIKSCKVGLVGLNIVEQDAYCEIEAHNYGAVIHYVPTDASNQRSFTGTSDYNNAFLTLYIYTKDWEKYDYLDFTFLASCNSVNSITCIMGSQSVPISVSEFTNSSWTLNDYLISVRVDLTSLDRTVDDYPMIIVEGNVSTSQVNQIAMLSCAGLIESFSVDSLSYWMNKLLLQLNTGFSNIGGWISNQSNVIGAWFGSLETSFSTGIDNIGLWISNQSNAISSFLTTHFSNLESWLAVHFSSLEATLQGLFEKDTSSGDELKDELSQQEETLQGISDTMESVTRPPLEDVDISVDSYVSPGDVILATQPLTVFLNNDIILTVLMMSLTMALGGYVLYGKR